MPIRTIPYPALMGCASSRSLNVEEEGCAGIIALSILATVVGWFSTYVVPLAVLLVAAVVVLWLLVQLVKKLSGGYDISDWWQ